MEWNVRQTRKARQDRADIIRWTVRHFGTRQAQTYTETIALALEALEAGPGIIGSQTRNDLGPDIRTLHVARGGRKGRHFIVYRIGDDHIIDVLRLLHDGMDLPSQLSP
ncbi:MAG: type II toxin-antitoxin system RelE/ParE family toxin [Stenotrophomonas sp.]